ncbi:MAG TPA: phosphatase [Halanaerobiales bacterium]|nr:phosphatase [Halanaerobiales bacterium]
MKIEADLHLHTVASGHAYSTITEMAESAHKKGLKMIAITDHGPLMPGGPHDYYFGNLRILPQTLKGVRVLKGVEANIMSNGEIDLDEKRLAQLDFVAAGIHADANYDFHSEQKNTEATVRAIKNPFVDMITHPANSFYPIRARDVIKAAAANDVIIEVNASSFDNSRIGKRGNRELCLELCCLAREKDVLLSLNSDAHFHTDVGNISCLFSIIEEAGLTEDNIINTSTEKIEGFLRAKGKEL